MPGNARAGQPDGKRHRKETAPWSGLPEQPRGKGETVGLEPTAGLATALARQAPPGAMPNRDRAPMIFGSKAGLFCPSRSGLAAVAASATVQSEEWSSPVFGQVQNPAYRPSAHIPALSGPKDRFFDETGVFQRWSGQIAVDSGAGLTRTRNSGFTHARGGGAAGEDTWRSQPRSRSV